MANTCPVGSNLPTNSVHVQSLTEPVCSGPRNKMYKPYKNKEIANSRFRASCICFFSSSVGIRGESLLLSSFPLEDELDSLLAVARSRFFFACSSRNLEAFPRRAKLKSKIAMFNKTYITKCSIHW